MAISRIEPTKIKTLAGRQKRFQFINFKNHRCIAITEISGNVAKMQVIDTVTGLYDKAITDTEKSIIEILHDIEAVEMTWLYG